MTEPSVQGLLAESFRVLAAELPAAWERFCAALDGLAVEIAVDGERFTVRFVFRAATITTETSRPAEARIETTKATILDVLDARLSLHDAVMREALQLIAPLALLGPLHQGILAYVHGGVRCPSFPSLLRRFRALSTQP